MRRPLPLLLQFLVRPHQGLCCGPLQEHPGFGIHRASQEVVRARVAGIELEGGIEAGEINQV